jgi:arsenate reductase
MTVRNVLFLCTHNSARSILGEAILNAKGAGRFHAFSAGSTPKDAPNSDGLALLAERGHPIDGFYSKTWQAFAAEGAPQMSIIITVCDNAAGEACPVWPGHPATAHWGIADPSAVGGDAAARRRAFEDTYAQLEERIERLLALPDGLEGTALKTALSEIGATASGATDVARSAP